jgi:hypothetical protein
MTTARTDPELGLVFPVVLTFGDEPPTEIGVVRAGIGPENVIAELAGVLHDCADAMVVGGDEAIRLARARYAELQGNYGAGAQLRAVVDYHRGDHLAARMLTTAEALQLQHRADGGARLVEVAEAEAEVVVSRGQLRGHCAHDIPLDQPCQMCERG